MQFNIPIGLVMKHVDKWGYWQCNFPMTYHVCWLDGWLVDLSIYNFLKGRKVTLNHYPIKGLVYIIQ